jgi:uncharacterized protein (TIGR02996 family)
MSHNEAFLQAIQASPEDLAIRLIYADWLEESGQPKQARYLRIQAVQAQLLNRQLRFYQLALQKRAVRETLPYEWWSRLGSPRFNLVGHLLEYHIEWEEDGYETADGGFGLVTQETPKEIRYTPVRLGSGWPLLSLTVEGEETGTLPKSYDSAGELCITGSSRIGCRPGGFWLLWLWNIGSRVSEGQVEWIVDFAAHGAGRTHLAMLPIPTDPSAFDCSTPLSEEELWRPLGVPAKHWGVELAVCFTEGIPPDRLHWMGRILHSRFTSPDVAYLIGSKIPPQGAGSPVRCLLRFMVFSLETAVRILRRELPELGVYPGTWHVRLEAKETA